MSDPSSLHILDSDTTANKQACNTNGVSPPSARVCSSATTQYHAQLYSRQQQLQKRQQEMSVHGPENSRGSGNPRQPHQFDLNFTPPSLYRTSLRLSAESNLDDWWATVVHLLSHAPFYATRAVLTVPQDFSDPWNGTWGIRASYNAKQAPDPVGPTSRPPDYFAQSPHADKPATSRCYDRLRPLESEAEPLINNPSVHRILRRHAMVVLSREYREKSLNHSPAAARHWPAHNVFTLDDSRDMFMRALLEKTEKSTRRHSWQTVTVSTPCLYRLEEGNPHNLFNEAEILAGSPSVDPTDSSHENDMAAYLHDYDEYEQQQPSPWSQSPAPSPAMMDPEINPFFQSAPGIDDDAFNPESPESYEHPSVPFPPPASNVHSVVHVPLTHPSNIDHAASGTASTQSTNRSQSAPSAILSFLSPVVPYPSSLLSFLTSLEPFIATSYYNAAEYSRLSAHGCQTPRRRRSMPRRSSSRPGKSTPGQSDPVFLGSMANFVRSSLETVTESANHSNNQGQKSDSDTNEQSSGSSSYSSCTSFHSAPATLTSQGRLTSPSPAWQRQAYQKPFQLNAVPSPSHKAVPEGWDTLSPNKGLLIKPSTPSDPMHSTHPMDITSTPADPLPRPCHGVSDCIRPRRRRKLKRRPFRSRGPIRLSGMNANVHAQGKYLMDASGAAPKASLLRLIIDGIPIHVFTCSPTTGQVTWVNSRTLQYTGLAFQDHLGSGWLSYMHPDDQPLCSKAWAAAYEQGNGFAGEYRLRRFDGAFRFFLWRIVPLRDRVGRIMHWFGTCTDVHDQHIAKESSLRQMELESNERKHRLLAEAIPQIVFTFLPGIGLTYANEKWSTYSGLSYERTKGFGFMSHVHPEDRQKLQLPDLEPQQAVGVVWQSQVRLLGADGNYRWFLVKTTSVDELETGHMRWFGTCTDINDHKLLEHKLKEAHDAAQKSTESKTQFLSNMSHEIRTPLIGITGMLNFLLDTELSAEQLDYANTIQQSAELLLVVINDILDVSKVEAGMMKLELEPFSLVTMIEDTNELLSTLAIQKGLELSYWVDDDVPDVVVGDRVRLRQVLLNLISNAIKFTNEGEIFTQCTVQHVNEEQTEITLLFEVVDTGTGFDADGEAVMFKPFSQVDSSSTRKHGGSGLGLVISRQLIELHGGQMKCKSSKGKGSTFYFTVKFGIPPPQTRPRPQTPQNETIGNPFFRTSVCSSVSSQDSSPISSGSGVGTLGPVSFVPSPLAHSKKHSQATDIPASMELLHDALLNKAASMKLRPPPARAGSGRQTPEGKAPEVTVNASAVPDAAADDRCPPTHHANLEVPASKVVPEWKLPNIGSVSSLLAPNTGVILPPRTPTRGAPLHIMVVSEWTHARETIVRHLRSIVKSFAEQSDCVMTVATNHMEAMQLIAYPQAPTYDYIIINLASDQSVISITRVVTGSIQQHDANVIIITTPMQRSLIMENAKHSQDELIPHNCAFEFKPLKRSKLNWYFGVKNGVDNDPNKHAASVQSDAPKQRVATQKEVFRRMKADVGEKGFRVLLVEDNLVNQKVLTRYLQRVGLEVDVACDGEEFVQLFLSHPHGYYALVLCDLFMPVKDGYEATRQIREWEASHLTSSDRPVPIVALSANVMGDVVNKCLECGFSTYISKPVNFATLSDVIRSHLLP